MNQSGALGQEQVNPEDARIRSRAIATITASGAGAIGAAFLFAPALGRLPTGSLWLAAVGAALLLISTAAYCAASLKNRSQFYAPAEYNTEALKLIGEVKRRTLGGSIAALLAITCLATALVLAVKWTQQSHAVMVSVSPAVQEKITDACPGVANPVAATIKGDPQVALAEPFVELSVASCGDSDGKSRWFLIPQRDVVLVNVVG